MPLNNRLDLWRNDLIDMSRRNPLLYYRSEGKRPTGIQFLPKDSSLLFTQLTDRPILSRTLSRHHVISNPTI